MNFIFYIMGISSSQLTNSYFSRWLKPPTSTDIIYYIYIFSLVWLRHLLSLKVYFLLCHHFFGRKNAGFLVSVAGVGPGCAPNLGGAEDVTLG